MRFLHISDLHLGKSLHGVSLLENGDQPCWVERFLTLAGELRPQAVLIAGDVYDRSAPSGEAMALFGRLLSGLAEREIPVLLVAGNHDSGMRIEYLRELIAARRIHAAGRVTRALTHVTLTDEHGSVVFWLMPYVFPAAVARALEDDTIRDYDTAVRRLLAEQPIDGSVRNVIISHQNVTAFGAEAARGGSESTVGGVGQVDHSAFDLFDYAALGHIHAACPVGRAAVRYSGSPMCYHFNETRQAEKGPLLVELGEKGTPPRIETLTIPPLHPLRELRGPFAELLEQEEAGEGRGEYLRLVLTDAPVSPETVRPFRELAERRDSVLMECVSEYRRFEGEAAGIDAQAVRERTPEELFADFYAARNGGVGPGERELALLREAGELLRNHPCEAARPEAVDETLTAALLDWLLSRKEGER